MSRAVLPAWSRSLRFRLTAWHVGVLALLLIAAAVLGYRLLRYALLEETDAFLRFAAQHLVVAADAGQDGEPDLEDMRQAVAAQETAPPRGSLYAPNRGLLLFDVVFLRYVIEPGTQNPTRQILASPDLNRQPDLIPSLDALLTVSRGTFSYAGPDEERTLRVYTVPMRFHGGIGYVQAAVPWDHNEDVLERLALLLVVLVPAITLVVAFGTWMLVGRTLQTIRRITSEAERLDATDVPEALLPGATETDSEIGELVTTLNRMTTRLHQSFGVQRRFAQAQQQFAADASHELRTPLTILRGEMELALSRPRSSDSYRATLHSALEETARLSRIVEGLGLLARQDATGMDTAKDWDTLDLSELARSVCEDVERRAAEKQVALDASFPTSLSVQGNADQLYLVLLNLVDNAVKFTESSGSVLIATKQDIGADGKPIASITVTDSGIGIAPEDIEHVFERFWRADRSRSTPGTGLGLAIAQQLAETHGGTLTVSSEPGKGSTFHLTLPALSINP